MSRPALLRLLAIVHRQLGASDARIEIGGQPSDDPRVLWAPLDDDARLVALFTEPPPDRDALHKRLEALAATFGTQAEEDADAFSPGTGFTGSLPARRLHEELGLLAGRTGALGAVVIDCRSPVIWGSSETPGAHEEEPRRTAAGEAAAPDKDTLMLRAIDAVRSATDTGSPPGNHLRLVEQTTVPKYFARSFASIYLLLLVFEESYSELHVQGAVLHALPVIERLVLALPPIDPTPARARRVVALRPVR